jgi:hypothetical protein
MSRRTPAIITFVGTFLAITTAANAAIAGADRKDAYTQHDEIRAKLDFNRRSLAKAYDKVGKRDPKWDDAALEFLDAAGLAFSYAGHGTIYLPGPTLTYAHLETLGKAALDAGCDDPLVRYCHGAFLHDKGQLAQAKPLVLAAADELEKSPYPPNRIAAAHRRAVRLLHAEKDKDEIARRQQAARAAWLRAAAMKFEPQDQRIVFKHITLDVGDDDVKAQRSFYDELRKLPDADPWIVNMIGGQYHIKNAWAWRGSGWAKDVTEQGWQGFYSNLKQARDCLMKAHDLHPEYPEAATLMITVGMGGGDDLGVDEREWFDKATSAQIDHLEAYSRYRTAMLPRWGGSYGQMHDVALECVKTDRYDTLVPHQYLATVYSVSGDSGRDDIWAHEPTFKQAGECLTRYAERNPSQAHNFLSHLAAIAWQAGQYAEAKSQLDRLGDKLDHSYLQSFASLPKLAVEQIHATTGPLAPAIADAEALLENEDVVGAVKAYDALVAKAAAGPGKAYVLARRNALDLWQRAESDWVTIAPDEHLTGWYSSDGSWSVDDQGRLVCTMNATEPAIVYPADLGRAYELRCRVEFDEAARVKPYSGPLVAYAGPTNRYGLYLHPRGDLVVRSGANYGHTFKTEVKPSNEIHVIVWGNSITTLVNGKLAQKDYRTRSDSPAEGTYFGFGAHFAPTGSVVRFSDIQVRRLTAEPANPGAE